MGLYVTVRFADQEVGHVCWPKRRWVWLVHRRYRSADDWSVLPMERQQLAAVESTFALLVFVPLSRKATIKISTNKISIRLDWRRDILRKSFTWISEGFGTSSLFTRLRRGRSGLMTGAVRVIAVEEGTVELRGSVSSYFQLDVCNSKFCYKALSS